MIKENQCLKNIYNEGQLSLVVGLVTLHRMYQKSEKILDWDDLGRHVQVVCSGVSSNQQSI
jgi:hypothetical protein